MIIIRVRRIVLMEVVCTIIQSALALFSYNVLRSLGLSNNLSIVAGVSLASSSATVGHAVAIYKILRGNHEH